MVTTRSGTSTVSSCINPFPFFRLPAELRNNIYALAYGQNRTRRVFVAPLTEGMIVSAETRTFVDRIPLLTIKLSIGKACNTVASRQYLQEATPFTIHNCNLCFRDTQSLRQAILIQAVRENATTISIVSSPREGEHLHDLPQLAANVPRLKHVEILVPNQTVSYLPGVGYGPRPMLSSTGAFRQAVGERQRLLDTLEGVDVTIQTDNGRWAVGDVERAVVSVEMMYRAYRRT